METSIRYSRDSRVLKLHAKEKLPIDSNTHLQVRGELDTKFGAPTYVDAMLRHFNPNLAVNLGVGLQYTKIDKLRYTVRGKKAFPVSVDGLVKFNVKGQCNVDNEFKERKAKGAAEFSLTILNFKKDQDVRLKVGYELIKKLAYMQIRENNWTLNVDAKGAWNIRYDL
ncbi:outer envelope pore protein 21B, chloroplastic-like [Impatiens glandulifera]|uniref:outer envelope pore protein 21B, chloroplastic-like n=1 Tax=Impatiens glandulifera TaxID=253017 RepID=UPI001FB16B36|nr:outer envelope pore protein 21B, chloroplastic-like [Impatiens glandulifera]